MKACAFAAFLAVAAAAAPKPHYGDPLDGCRSDETKLQLGGVPGAFCAPKCDFNSSTPTCPTDVSQGTTAKPVCAHDSGKDYCFLDCSDSKIGAHCAGPDATCKYSEFARVCTYDERKPPQPADSHYTNPKYGCRPDEKNTTLLGMTGDFCAPKCDFNSSTPTCPTDIPKGTDAKPVCAHDAGKDYCYLLCATVGQPCGYSATCKYSEFAYVCTYDEWPLPPPHIPHYGDPKDGCKSDEVVMQVPGTEGVFCSPKCSSNSPCPTDVPFGMQPTKPECSDEGFCFLKCNGYKPWGDQCDANEGNIASCKQSKYGLMCTYDDDGRKILV